MAAGTPESFVRLDFRAGMIDLALRADGRLDIAITIGSHASGTRRVTGVMAARADRHGRFGWRARGRMLPMSLFRWNYRLIADGRLMIAGHGGSIASQPTYVVLARADVDRAQATELLDAHLRRLGLTQEELADLLRFDPPVHPETGATAR